MEQVYKPLYFDATEHVDLKKHFEVYSKELLIYEQQKGYLKIPDEIINPETGVLEVNPITQNRSIEKPILEDQIFSFINDSSLDAEKQKQLNDICSLNHLNTEGDVEQMWPKDIIGSIGITKSFKPYEITPESETLATVQKYLKRSVIKRWREDGSMSKKYFEFDINTNEDTDLTPAVDFVVFVRTFQPFVFNYAIIDRKKNLKFDHEIALIGSNTLADLRDKIFCVRDSAIITDVSENLNTEQMLQAKEIYPSSFIFIDGVFYNDFRNDSNIDYSQVIRKWASEKGIGNFNTEKMDETRIDSLKPRFGYPYVYQHLGKCEHIFIFGQARLLSTEDCLSSKEYPYYSGIQSSKTVFCYICGHSQAAWLVLDCERLPLNKAPLCNDCLKSYCYLDGKKIGKFKCFLFTSKKDIL